MAGKRSHTLVLSGEAGIKAAAEVASSLKQALASHDHIDIDTRSLASADLTTAQTLLAARNAAAAAGKQLRMLTPLGAPLEQLLAATGLLSAGQPHRDFWAATSDHA